MEGFHTGNIVRIHCKDFLTFDEIEVRPKPHLNVVIGPNGTGKSTLLCAICIGLGGKPAITGRGKDVGEYVKHGKDKATLEIELYVQSETNLIVKRIFDRKNKSNWYLQGKEVNKKTVDEKVAEMNIQVDNLCQFLPQDRVANFAKMNKYQLLEATENSVGDASLFEQHNLLKQGGEGLLQVQNRAQEIEAQLQNEIKKNERLEDAVKNWDRKKNLDTQIERLGIQKMYFSYDEKRKKANQIKGEYEKQKIDVEQESKKLAPYRNEIYKNKKIIQSTKQVIKDKEDTLKQLNREYEAICKKYNKEHENIEDSRRDYESKVQEEDKREKALVELKRQLDIYTTQMEALPTVIEEDLMSEIQQLTANITASGKQMAGLQERSDNCIHNKRGEESKLLRLRRELESQQDVKQQKLELLRQQHRDVYTAAQWLENNRDKFNGKVFPPMCTQINIKDRNLARYVEDLISNNDLTAFLCENKDDMNTFKRLMDQQAKRLRVNIIHGESCNPNQFQPPQPVDEIRRYGFKCYMSDVIEAPNEIYGYLCRNYRIHTIPIADQGNMDSVPAQFSKFYMNNNRYSKNKSRYDGEIATSIKAVRPERLLCISEDTSKIQNTNIQIQAAQQRISSVQQEFQIINEEVKTVEKKMAEERNRKKILQSQRDGKKTLQSKIDNKNEQISRANHSGTNLEDEKKKMETTINRVMAKMVDMTCANTEKVKKSGEISSMVLSLIAQHNIIKEDISRRENALSEAQQLMQEKERRQASLQAEFKTCKSDAAKELQTFCQSLGLQSHKELTNEIREEYELPGAQHSATAFKCLEEVLVKMEDLQAQREVLITADDNVVNEYNRRLQTIDNLREKMESFNARVRAENRKLEDSRSKWLPDIKELTEQLSSSFSEFMSRMGCAGDVSLENAEDENDFTKYGLVIRVRFRDNEKLRELTAQHQSGGERAVSTALYLLALQGLTTVPFRCVDEINQGMDQRNERRMFEMLMETTSAEDASQYFFVTPKLLNNLQYNERVNFMVVYNSPTMLAQRYFSFSEIIRKEKKRQKKEGLHSSNHINSTAH